MTDDQVSSVPVTVCIAMSEGGTFLSAFADTHWIQEDRKHQDLLKRVREDKQLWSVKYIRTSIQYPITTEKKDKFIGTITNYTDLELRLQTEVAELKVSLEKEQALTAHHRTVQVELLSKVAELKAKLAELAKPEPEIYGYVSTHRWLIGDVSHHKFHFNLGTVYQDNCSSVTPVYLKGTP